jgi:hypothetical protein
MKRISLIITLLLFIVSANAQKYMTKNGYIMFYSHTPLEDVKAENNQVASALDSSTGEMVFQALMRSFHFEKALMEEHFNENYNESDKYPKTTFNGKITNFSSVDFSKKGTYDVNVEGDLTLHGVTNKVNTKGTLTVTDNGVEANSKFNLVPEDFKFTIPGVVREKINKSMEVTVNVKYTPVAQK